MMMVEDPYYPMYMYPPPMELDVSQYLPPVEYIDHSQDIPGSSNQHLNRDDYYKLIYHMKLSRNELYKNGYPLMIDSARNLVHIEPNQFTQPVIMAGDRRRKCVRCNEHFTLDKYGRVPVIPGSCSFHQRGSYNTPYGPRKNCCNQPIHQSKGCTMMNVHVFDNMEEEDMYKFVKTPQADGPDDCRSMNVLAIDCEMAYTNKGLSLVKVSVVDMNGILLLDQIVRPEGQLLCPNTMYSGVTAAEINGSTVSLESVQKMLFTLINAETILIGHSLESDLKALRLVHTNVVDTAVIYMEYGIKPSLRSLTSTHLGKLIQQDKGIYETHNSVEDAVSCIELIENLVANKL